MSNTTRRVLVTVGILSLLVLALMLGACGDPAPRPIPVPVTCATWQDNEQRWREEDGELVDDDPCDLDDLFKVRTTAPAKPKPAVSPAKPNVRTTRR